jgi:hypothetical protein
MLYAKLEEQAIDRCKGKAGNVMAAEKIKKIAAPSQQLNALQPLTFSGRASRHLCLGGLAVFLDVFT